MVVVVTVVIVATLVATVVLVVVVAAAVALMVVGHDSRKGAFSQYKWRPRKSGGNRIDIKKKNPFG